MRFVTKKGYCAVYDIADDRILIVDEEGHDVESFYIANDAPVGGHSMFTRLCEDDNGNEREEDIEVIDIPIKQANDYIQAHIEERFGYSAEDNLSDDQIKYYASCTARITKRYIEYGFLSASMPRNYNPTHLSTEGRK